MIVAKTVRQDVEMEAEKRIGPKDETRLTTHGLDGPIAAEGYPFIGLAGLATLVFAALGWAVAALAALVAAAFTAFFFRNPERHIPKEATAIVSPADGRIITIDPLPEGGELFNDEVVRVSIFMSIFNVHVNRIPLDGRVVETKYSRGGFRVASSRGASESNERLSMVIETPGGRRIEVVQVAGIVARRIVSYARPGDQCARGERFGLIRFGSRLDVYLPADVSVRARIGDRVRSGETILGEMS